jgi:hypothetical protein
VADQTLSDTSDDDQRSINMSMKGIPYPLQNPNMNNMLVTEMSIKGGEADLGMDNDPAPTSSDEVELLNKQTRWRVSR